MAFTRHGFWTATLEGTAARMNLSLAGSGPKADFPAANTCAGSFAIATDEHKMYYSDGADWIACSALDLADMTERAHGSLTGVGTSDHHVRYSDAEACTAVKAGVKVNELQAPDGALAMNTQKITGLLNPADAQDAATKDYVDDVVVALGAGDMTKVTYDPNTDGVIAMAQLDTQLRTLTQINALIAAAIAAALPSGVIAMWAGLVANVPAGWLLCDGNNGTPNLSDKFIKGTTGNPGATGGAATHTHTTHSALSHTGAGVSAHSVGQPGSHSGNTGSGGGDATASAIGLVGVSGPGLYFVNETHAHGQSAHTHSISLAHSGTSVGDHSFTQAASHAAQSHNAVSNEPVYYAMCFIQKI